LRGETKFDFKNNEKLNGLLTGKIDYINMKANEIKVFKGDVEVPSEETTYTARFNEFMSSLNDIELSNVFEKIPVLGGIPIQPYPAMAKCLGLSPRAAMVEIEDRFMRLAYDFRVSPADPKCLFDVFEDEDYKFKRWENETGERMPKLAKKARNFIPNKNVVPNDYKKNLKKGFQKSFGQ